MTPKFSRNIVCRTCEGNIREAVEHEDMLCDEVETVGEFTYRGDKVSAGEGCEAAVTARVGRLSFGEFGGLLCDRRFPLNLKGDVF